MLEAWKEFGGVELGAIQVRGCPTRLTVCFGFSEVVLVLQNLTANAGDIETRFDPWLGKIPWRRSW